MPLHEEVVNLLNQHYDVLEIINLIKYDCDLDALIKLLHQYREHVFEPRQRIIILHHDTDYYQTVHGEVQGNSMFNLFTLFSSFDIACEKIVFVTNNYGIQTELDRLARDICNSSSPLVIYTALWYDFPRTTNLIESNTPEPSDIKHVYCCLNRAQRQHRVITLCYLQELGLIPHGMISYLFAR